MPAKAKKRCPECGVSVRIDKIEDHMKKIHPDADRKGILTEEEKTKIVRQRKVAERRPISKKETSLYLVGLLIIVVVILFLVFYKPPEITDAPDFTIKDTDGSTFHLREHGAGKVVFLNLMDTKCSHCQLETKNVLIPLYSKYASRVVFLSIDVQILGTGTIQEIQQFKTDNGATWRYFLDTDGVASKYQVSATPTTYIIDRNMKVFYHVEGESKLDTLSAKLDAVLG